MGSDQPPKPNKNWQETRLDETHQTMLDEIDRLKAELERLAGTLETAYRDARRRLLQEAQVSKVAGDSIERMLFRLRTVSLKGADGCYEKQLAEADELIGKYGAAIRAHRDQRGDDRCFLDDDALYAVLPEGKANADTRLCEPDVMLANCRRYIEQRHDPALPYVSTQREIERLEAEVRALKKALGG